MTNLEALSTEMEGWENTLKKFKDNMATVLEEIRKQKKEIQEMRTLIDNELSKVKYVRDDDCLVLSAPKIIIGNVDCQGNLLGNSQIVLRGNDICISAVGDKGAVHTHAANIQLVNDDMGPDGHEAYVHDGAKIVALGKAISMKAEAHDTIFVAGEDLPAVSGQISIEADHHLELLSQKDRNNLETNITNRKKKLNDDKPTLKKEVDDLLTTIEENITKANGEASPTYNVDPGWWHRHFFFDAKEHQKNYKELVEAIYGYLKECDDKLATLVECNRQISALEQIKIPTKQELETKATDCRISINSEKIDIASMDGKNFRNIPDGAVNILSPNINLTAGRTGDCIIENGKISMRAQDVDIDTAQLTKESDTKQTFKTHGTVRINSKDITLESHNYQLGKNNEAEDSDDNATDEFDVKGSHLYVRTHHVNIDTNKVKGESHGSVAVVSKVIDLYGCNTKIDDNGKRDVDPKGELAKDSHMKIMADKIFIGHLSDKLCSTTLNLTTNDIKIKSLNSVDINLTEKDGSTVVINKDQCLLQNNTDSIKIETAQANGTKKTSTTINSETTITKNTSIESNLEVPSIIVHTEDNNGLIKSDKLNCPDISSSDITASGTIEGKTLHAKTQLIAPNTKKK